MTWFRVDDSAHTHPKLRGAGTAAIGLWALGGSYAAHYLTDGRVHAHFIKTNATAPQLAKLVKAGLWHPAGHACGRCPQPGAGDFQIHDYLIYNMSRTQVEKAREKAAAKKRGQRAGTDSTVIRDGIEEDSVSNRDGIEDDSRRKSSPDSESSAGHGAASPGDTNHPRARGSQLSSAHPPLSTKEEELAGADAPATPLELDDRIPAFARPLIDALWHRGIRGLQWGRISWTELQALMKAKGIDAMVESAIGSIARSRAPVTHATYLLPGWHDLANAPTGPAATGPALRAVPAPGTSKSANQRAGLNRIRDKLQQQGDTA